MVLPSLKSTQSVSTETVRFSAKGTSISTAEVLIPCLHKRNTMIAHPSFDPRKFQARKPAAVNPLIPS
jgi:hypothetical protein